MVVNACIAEVFTKLTCKSLKLEIKGPFLICDEDSWVIFTISLFFYLYNISQTFIHLQSPSWWCLSLFPVITQVHQLHTTEGVVKLFNHS